MASTRIVFSHLVLTPAQKSEINENNVLWINSKNRTLKVKTFEGEDLYNITAKNTVEYIASIIFTEDTAPAIQEEDNSRHTSNSISDTSDHSDTEPTFSDDESLNSFRFSRSSP